MANAMREQIGGTSPQDIMKINENFESMWYKVHGDVDFSDTNKGLKNRIMTQWLPVQGSGNLDSNYPLDIRFYIPPNVDTIKSTNFSVNLSNYRMDSGIANGGGGVENVEINLSMGSSNIVCGVQTSEAMTHPVWLWSGKSGNIDNGLVPPLKSVGEYGQETYTWDSKGYYVKGTVANGDFRYGLPMYPVDVKSGETFREEIIVDAMSLNHVHKFPGHSHTFTQSPHTHSGSGKVTLAPHTHALNEGIKVSTKPLTDTVIHINGEPVSVLNGATMNVNNIDISQHIKVGEWNIIRCTSSSVARVELYGVIELIIKG